MYGLTSNILPFASLFQPEMLERFVFPAMNTLTGYCSIEILNLPVHLCTHLKSASIVVAT